jgi:uncharacterized repeat protein (TIGR01451 family)
MKATMRTVLLRAILAIIASGALAVTALATPAFAHVTNAGPFTLNVTSGTVQLGSLQLPLPSGSGTGQVDTDGNITIPQSPLQVTDEPFSDEVLGFSLTGTATFQSGPITGTLDPGTGAASLNTSVFASVTFAATLLGAPVGSGTCSIGGSAPADYVPVALTTGSPAGVPYSQQTGTVTVAGDLGQQIVCQPANLSTDLLQIFTGSVSRVVASAAVTPILTDDSHLSLAPNPLAFGDVQVGISKTRTLTFSDPGTDPTYVTGAPVLGGDNPGDFTLVDQSLTCQQASAGFVIPAGGSCSIDVQFMAAAAGGRSATLTVPTSSSDGPQTLTLTGTGINPGLSATPGSLTFGQQVVGTTSASKGVTIANTGTTDLIVTGAQASGDFTADASGCTAQAIAPGQACVISVVFSPTATGSRAGTLSITSNAASSPDSVSLSGTGVAPVISVSPTSVKFGSVLVTTTSTPAAVTVSNGGTSDLTVTSASASGPFGVSSDDCSSAGPIPPGGTCQIEVVFMPVTTGPATGTLTVASDGGTATAALSGTGAPLADLNVSIGASPNPVRKTANLTYAITVRNAGPSDAASTLITDTLPSNVQFVSLTAPSASTCTTPAVGATGTVKCNTGTLAAGTSNQLQVVVKVVAPKGTTILNTVKATSSTTDPDPADNQATVATAVK